MRNVHRTAVASAIAGENKAPFSLIGQGIAGMTDGQGRFRIQWLSSGGYDLFAGGPQFHFDAVSGQTLDIGDLMTTNLETSPFNCGACGNTCGTGQACVAGICSTPLPPDCSGHGTLIGGVCVCSPGWIGPNCETPSSVCGPGAVSCGGTCTPILTDPNNCGGCNRPCAAGQICANGVCAAQQTGPAAAGTSLLDRLFATARARRE